MVVKKGSLMARRDNVVWSVLLLLLLLLLLQCRDGVMTGVIQAWTTGSTGSDIIIMKNAVLVVHQIIIIIIGETRVAVIEVV